MALPTYAQYAAEFAALRINPTWGELYFNHAPIFRMLPMEQRGAGRVKVNYTDGATAASLGTGAGIPSTGAPAQVNDTETKVYAAIASQASVDLPSLVQGDGGDANRSANAAVNALYREFVEQLLSTQNGETFAQLWGVKDFLGVTQETDSMTVSGSFTGSSFTNTLLKKDIGKMISKLPQDGSMNVCITSADGYEAVYNAIEGAGGITPAMTAMDTFGFSNLVYRNTVFFATDKQTSFGFGGDLATDFWFFNTGPEGIVLCVPDTVPMILTDGPKKAIGYLSDVWDIVLNCQVIYQGHHSAGRLQTWIST